MEDYMTQALLLEAKDHEAQGKRAAESIRLLHGAMGACTEAGELLDQLKKVVFYGRELDRVNVMEEVGDILWYCALILEDTGYTFEQAMERNIAKLRERYPYKFTEFDAANRDLRLERKALEGA